MSYQAIKSKLNRHLKITKKIMADIFLIHNCKFDWHLKYEEH